MQQKLGLDRTPALDIRQQCTGFIYGLAMADAFIRSGYYRRILFVGGEVHSTGLDLSTAGRDVSAIFGDGAGAVRLECVDDEAPTGILASALYADGALADSLMIEGPASRNWPRMSEKMIQEGRHYPIMDGQKIFKTAVRRLPEVAHRTLSMADLKPEDIDLYIPHQANLRINQAFQGAMKLPEDRVFHNVQKFGNTTAASIPIALDEALESGTIGPGSTVMFIALGAGLTWGAVIFRFGNGAG